MNNAVVANKYCVLEYIGQGGFGNIYKVKDEHIDKLYVMKVQPLQRKKDYNNEIEILRTLKHSGLPALHDMFLDDNNIYIIMEMAEGITLEEYIKEKGKLSIDEAVQIGRGLSEIIAYLHSRSIPIIHGDLKPANIIIRDGKVSLIDFGGALRAYAETNTIYGTLTFAAPEWIEGEFSTRSDVYSFGYVMFYMLTGRKGNGIEEKNSYKVLKTYGVPPKIRRIILKCIQKNPDMRYPGGSELEKAIKAVKNPQRKFPGITAFGISRIFKMIGMSMLFAGVLFYKYRDSLWMECTGYVMEFRKWYVYGMVLILISYPFKKLGMRYYKRAILECECSILVTEGSD